MNLRISVCVTAILALSASAKQVPEQEIDLRVLAGSVSGLTLAMARGEASSILSQLGLRVHWRDHLQPVRECRGDGVDVSEIEILIRDRTRPSDHPGAFAYSLPFAKSGVRIVIFYDRIYAATLPPRTRLLGHVIAHEVGHMLLGTLEHSAAGIMRPYWKSADLSAMALHPLAFTPGDVEMISNRLQRQQRSCVIDVGKEGRN